MELIEVQKDLFTVDSSYALAHCISADFKLGAGIAVLFNVHCNCKQTLFAFYPDYLDSWRKNGLQADCLKTTGNGRTVYNLITKERYFMKPTYASIREALEVLADMVDDGEKIAMPTIGCGLDYLDWSKVRDIICDVFKNRDTEIMVCKL